MLNASYGRNGNAPLDASTIIIVPAKYVECLGLVPVSADGDGLASAVWAWGDNSSGQLGDGTVDSRSRAAPVPGLSDVVAVCAGSSYSLAVKRDGTVWAWGYNGEGQLGSGTLEDRYQPTQVVGIKGVSSVSAGNATPRR